MKIIAELGSNWKSFEDCKNAIPLAKNCGANAIKFQLYTHKELYGHDGDIAGAMPREWIEKLKIKSTACGIEFMCTAFSAEGVSFIDPYVETHKLASSEMCHTDMLWALYQTNKNVLVSTGAQTPMDIAQVAKILPMATFLYCEAAYPARHVDVRKLEALKAIVNKDVGYSDHTLDVYVAPLAARDAGAVVLEKHFNPFNYTDTPDSGHSLGVNDFMAMVKAIRSEDAVECVPTRDELPMLLRHKRRLIATCDIKVGDVLHQGGNFGIYRSKIDDTVGAHPGMANMINGKISDRDYKLGDPIVIVP